MTIIVEDMDRFSIVELLDGTDNVGIELGVAAGGFSANMMQSGKLSKGFGVDLYSDHHDMAEYQKALLTVGMDANYSLLKMSFDDALDLFPDDHFDFIYIDGYAHTGEQGGKTFFDWLPKLKQGGILAGDDYADRWPLVKQAVHYFVEQVGAELHVTDPSKVHSGSVFNASPSWFIYNKDLKSDWRRNEEMEAHGLSVSQVTQEKHNSQLELGKVFLALINETMQKQQPAFVEYGDKRIYVVAK
ncbi:class I SAM-dependent methyltransferase [Cohaesibacter celericrescens]|uniref:class I SAM-dependent methyltransferase n=1 Tax=Cohaesibacter celericrescens TaxID=2067669 RepID=UPI0035644672